MSGALKKDTVGNIQLRRAIHVDVSQIGPLKRCRAGEDPWHEKVLGGKNGCAQPDCDTKRASSAPSQHCTYACHISSTPAQVRAQGTAHMPAK